MQIVIAIVVSLLATGIVVLFRSIVPSKGRQLESAQATTKKIAVSNVCAFCGKPVGLNCYWPQQMHRVIKSEVILMGTSTTYENIKVRLPCCRECEALNRKALRRANKKSMIAAVAVAAIAVVCFVRSGVNSESIADLFWGGAVVSFIIGCLTYVLVRRLERPEFENQIREHALIVALSRKGWKIGKSPGVETDNGNNANEQ